MKLKSILTGLALLVLASGAFAQSTTDAYLSEYEKEVKRIESLVTPSFVFFFNKGPQGQIQGGGSGVCISPDGWVLTNHHTSGKSR
jgi:S1-C subfamily serine protease